MNLGGRVQFLQAQLFPTYPLTPLTPGGRGFLGSFLSKGLKTNQLEVNTDEKTLRPIARLKEPRDLFALPKDKDNDCSQQAPRWPIECQVIEERIKHIPNIPTQPETFYQQTGNELKPNPVGEENGIVVFNYNPISAVNYDKTKRTKSKIHVPQDSSDSDVSSCESQASTPDVAALLRHDKKVHQTITNLLNTLEQRSSSNSNAEYDDDDDEDDEEEDEEDTEDEAEKTFDDDEEADRSEKAKTHKKHKNKKRIEQPVITEEEIDSIWADKSPEYMAATPTFIKTKIDKNIKAQQSKALPPVRVDEELITGLQVVLSRSSAFPHANKNSANDKTKGLTNPTNANGNYRKRKENPLFNTDMSINLNELAKLTQATVTPMQYFQNSSSQIKSCKVIPNICTITNINPLLKTSYYPQDLSYNSVSSSGISTPFSSTNDNLNRTKHSNSYVINDCKSYNNSYLPQFSRSAVGGSKFLTNCHPYNPDEYDGLEFEARFESGNLAKAIQITPTYYELYLRPDLYTSRSKQWFYFRVKRTKKNMIYRFSIVNLIKSDSLYNEGMRPLMYSTINAKTKNIGWTRCADNICYYRNDDDQPSEEDEDNSSYTLTFNIEFEHDNDTVFFAHSYPYTYSDLQDYLMEIQKNPIKSKFCKLRLLCRTLAGNNVYYLTVTTPVANEEIMKRKKSIVVSARVHPSETPSSWMMKGLMDFITGDSTVAKRLRHKFIFKLIPMLNPDGVIVGNTRNSLTGKDLNRQYRTVIRETYPSIWYTKALIKRLIDDCGVSMYCDMHAHSRRHNIFIYGCENKRNAEKKLTEQVFPLMLHKNVADKFSFENCKFKIQRSKEGTGRIVVWMLGITNSYTIEASFGGSLLGSRKGTHFTTADYEHMGRAFCETLWDYCDETPNKESLRLKIIERLLKEGSNADEPINIPLSDYSSDEGSSSSSDNEGKCSTKDFSDLEGPCCQPLRVPPSSPEFDVEVRKLRYSRMCKVMQVLDRIYFQPLFHKKCMAFFKKNRFSKTKKCRQKFPQKTIRSNSEHPNNGCSQTLKGGFCTRNPNSESLNNASINGSSMRNKIKHVKKRLKWDQELKKKPPVKVSRKLRLWLGKRKIFIVKRRMHNKFKIRLKSSHRRKKSERLVLDMPTSDPGSDLLFSTDDENIDGALLVPARIRHHLLKSEMQKRYIEEIGNKLTKMPPELIITSPSNKDKQKNHYLRLFQKPAAAAEKPERKHQTRSELPFIGHSTKRTRSWHNLNTSGEIYCKPSTTKYKAQSPFHRPLSKKEILSKEDLDIKLSLKKKIWAGIQPDDVSLDIDRTRPLSWVASHSLKSKKTIVNQNQSSDFNFAHLSSWKKLENEALLTACSRKLLEWQMRNLNDMGTSQSIQKINEPLNLVVPDINQDRTLYILKHLDNIKTPFGRNNEIIAETKPEKSNISKVVETTNLFKKLSKSCNNISTSHRTANKLALNQHKSHIRTNKFKTGGLVVTAVQTGVNSGTCGVKKNKKLKSLHHKLPNVNICNANNSDHSKNINNKVSLTVHSTGTNVVKKVKTKLKKKKLCSNTKSENAININSYDSVTK